MSLLTGHILPMVTNGLWYPMVRYIPIFVSEGTLDVSPATIIRQYIVDVITLLQTPSGSAVWPCYIGSMPDGDGVEDDSACVYDTSGVTDGRLQENGRVIQHYGVQLLVRSRDYQNGWQKADAVSAGLSAMVNYDVTVDGEDYRIHNVTRSSPVVPLGMEEETKRRWLFTANFLVTISQTT